MRNITIGILAHVDAGKTTLSESILYLSGKLRTLGRVDHKDAFLDTHELERSRGITIFSKQAVFPLDPWQVTLLDTPGHVDFSAEMERTLQVLDYAILVINGADGIQGHTRTLWGLLKRYNVPVFLFVNKMDQEGTDRKHLLEELKNGLDDQIMAFDVEKDTSFYENAAMGDERALEEYLEAEKLTEETIAGLIMERKVFPCYFGSALKVEGVQQLLDGLAEYMETNADEPADFGARVYKISRDDKGNRLTHMKVTSGKLKVKEVLENHPEDGEHWEEKVNQIRIYSGDKFEAVPEVSAGTICAVTGLSMTKPGEGLGVEAENVEPVLEPVLTYQVLLPEGCDVSEMLRNLRQLEEEDPLLRVVWKEELSEIHVCLMGEVQIQILHELILERFGVDVTFGEGNIVYKETITNRVEGVGHYEPLRHYAEVHLIMGPGEPGSGLTFDTICSEDDLDRNWQRLIFTHLEEREHRGVLTGAPITDMKITLAAGKAHLKHTEGGDFRQSTYRAIRQGLMQADSVLLEPYYTFELEIPASVTGRALNDMQRLAAEAEAPQQEGDRTRIKGLAPVATMRDYQREVAAYSHGEGRLACVFSGYRPCHNAEEVIEAIGYDAERDMENPTGSVFCSHGAGYYVPWDEVPEHAHADTSNVLKPKEEEPEQVRPVRSSGTGGGDGFGGDAELRALFERTYGPVKNRGFEAFQQSRKKAATLEQLYVTRIREDDYLLVDGYNIIFAWDELNALSKESLDAARHRLMDILCNYQGFKKCVLILVFDAYRVPGSPGSIEQYHNIHVVYTKEAETADMFIERVTHEIGRNRRVRVATSDGMEQIIILGHGALRVSARMFHEEVQNVEKQIRALVQGEA